MPRPARWSRRIFRGSRSLRVIGLTGGIGMGKSTAAAVFRARRIPVFDADREVHRLQSRGGGAVAAIAALAPRAVQAGGVDRVALRRAVAADPALLPALERLLHPMVRRAEHRFLGRARASGHTLAVLDIPLLFETGADRLCDVTVAVSAPRDLQLRRVLARGSGAMSRADALRLIARQMPDGERRRRADLVVPTGLSRHESQRRLRRLLRRLASTPRPRS